MGMWTLLIVYKWFPLFHLIICTTNPRTHFLFSLHVIWHLCQQSNFLIHCNIRQKGFHSLLSFPPHSPLLYFTMLMTPSSSFLSSAFLFVFFLCLRGLNTSFLFWMGSNPCFHIPFLKFSPLVLQCFSSFSLIVFSSQTLYLFFSPLLQWLSSFLFHKNKIKNDVLPVCSYFIYSHKWWPWQWALYFSCLYIHCPILA